MMKLRPPRNICGDLRARRAPQKDYDERDEFIVDAAQCGYSRAQISAAIGVCAANYAFRFRRLGVPADPQQESEAKVPHRRVTLTAAPFDLPPEPPRLIAASPVRHLPKGPGADWDGEAA